MSSTCTHHTSAKAEQRNIIHIMGVFDISNAKLVAYGAVSILLYCAALAVYRVTLHPLAKFPGPRLAATTEWYEFYHDIVQQGKFIWHIQKLHDQYGWYTSLQVFCCYKQHEPR